MELCGSLYPKTGVQIFSKNLRATSKSWAARRHGARDLCTPVLKTIFMTILHQFLNFFPPWFMNFKTTKWTNLVMTVYMSLFTLKCSHSNCLRTKPNPPSRFSGKAIGNCVCLRQHICYVIRLSHSIYLALLQVSLHLQQCLFLLHQQDKCMAQWLISDLRPFIDGPVFIFKRGIQLI
jgi:hypothetical protein